MIMTVVCREESVQRQLQDRVNLQKMRVYV